MKHSENFLVYPDSLANFIQHYDYFLVQVFCLISLGSLNSVFIRVILWDLSVSGLAVLAVVPGSEHKAVTVAEEGTEQDVVDTAREWGPEEQEERVSEATGNGQLLCINSCAKMQPVFECK